MGRSVFLKLRKLWKIMEWGDVGDPAYNLLAILNLIAFVLFRLCVFVFFITWWTENMHTIPLLHAIVPFCGSLIVLVINLHYFHLLLKTDIGKMISNRKLKL